MNEKTLIRIITDLISQLESAVADRDRFKQYWLDEKKKSDEKAKEVSA